jgi:hypothetical protein
VCRQGAAIMATFHSVEELSSYLLYLYDAGTTPTALYSMQQIVPARPGGAGPVLSTTAHKHWAGAVRRIWNKGMAKLAPIG